MTRAERYIEAERLAAERATHWAVARRDNDGNLLTGFDTVEAGSEERAIIEACNLRGVGIGDKRAPRSARPKLKTSEWDAIYEEVGLR